LKDWNARVLIIAIFVAYLFKNSIYFPKRKHNPVYYYNCSEHQVIRYYNKQTWILNIKYHLNLLQCLLHFPHPWKFTRGNDDEAEEKREVEEKEQRKLK